MEKCINCRIHEEDYTLITGYQEDKHYRDSLNRLTGNTYGFDFENWFQQGYWSDRYRPYSLVHSGEIVANVSVNPIDFLIDGELHSTVQLGTVMTDPTYRHKGLSRFLMEYVLREYENACECIYLYANDSVLDFYPKFGFIEAEELRYTKVFYKKNNRLSVRKLDIRSDPDKELLTRLVNNTIPVSGYSMVGNPGLWMFYLTSFLADSIYYIEALDLAAVATFEEDNLHLIEVFCEHDFEIDQVIQSLCSRSEQRITLGFTPIGAVGYEAQPGKEEGSTFFYRGKKLIGRGRFPELSHA